MTYLLPSEYESFGLEPATSEAWAAAASALIDAHCRRPTLVVAEYRERLRLRPGRNSLRLTWLPLAALAPAATPFVSVRARYAVPRRGESGSAAELAADAASAFGLPGQWSGLDPATLDFAAETGEVSLPTHALGLGYNEAEVVYTAGLAPIPGPVKTACAHIVRNALATPALNVRSGALDRMHLEYFADSLLDSDVRKLLAPYVAQKVA